MPFSSWQAISRASLAALRERRPLSQWVDFVEQRHDINPVIVRDHLHDADDCCICDDCGNYELDNETVNALGRRGAEQTFCRACAEDDIITCDDCGQRYHVDRYSGGCNSNDTPVCESCGESYFSCVECNQIRANDCYACDGRCQDCENSAAVPEYHSTRKAWRSGSHVGHVLGVELEIASKHTEDCPDIVEYLTDLGFIVERDGSLDSERGLEIVAHPCAYGQAVEAWLPVLDYLRRRGCLGWDMGTGYGMHVSVNRAAMSMLHQAKLLIFVHHNTSLCEHVAGRKQNQWAEYHQKTFKSIREPGEKYEALAVRSERRMEFRMFRSTLSEEGFKRNLQFVEAAVAFTRDAAPADLRSDCFTSFVSIHRKDYPELFAHLFPARHAEYQARKTQHLKTNVPCHLQA